MSDTISPPPHSHITDDKTASFIDTIVALKANSGPQGASIAEIVDQLDERAFGLLILLFAIPCLVPGLPGAQVIAIPIFLLALQLGAGRSEVWLPKQALQAVVKKPWLDNIADFTDKRLRWSERLSRPRLTWLASGPAERIIGIIVALAALTIMLPITNTIPSLAITLVAIGLLQRDGLFTVSGTILALTWVLFLGAIVWGLFTGAGFAVEFMQERMPWLATYFTPPR